MRTAQLGLDDTVHQQVGVATNRAGEVGVGLERQTKVPRVFRRVEGLHHGAQQHGVNLLRIRAILGSSSNLLELLGRRVLADAHTHAHGLEVVAQNVLLFQRGLVVHAEQPQLAALVNEVGATDVGRQHGFFNQLVRIIAGARHDFFDTAVVVTDDLRLCGLKVHRTARFTRFEQ